MIDYQTKALEAVHSGDYEEAINLWQRQLNEDPVNEEAMSQLGSLYFKLELYDKAAKYLRNALVQNQDNVVLQVLLANSLMQLDQLAEAKSCFQGAIAQETNNIAARIGLAKLYLRQNDVERAIETLKTALDIKPNDTQVCWELAEIYKATGELEQAEDYLRQILESRSESTLVKQARKILDESFAKRRGVDLTDLKILRSENLMKTYGKRRVVKQVSIEVRQGEIVGLLGPNGAGKTTTFYMITGMIRPNSGKVFLNDRNITNLPMYRRSRLGIGYLAQEASIFRKLTVEDNIMAILQTLKIPGEEREQKLEELLEEFGIKYIRKNKAYNLSGGERRRVEISRALVLNPQFLLLDEPFSGIDPIAVEDIQNIIHRLRDRGIGILITDHNVHETLEITDRAYLLYDGRILKSGSAEFLANDPEARTLYLGDKFRLDR